MALCSILFLTGIAGVIYSAQNLVRTSTAYHHRKYDYAAAGLPAPMPDELHHMAVVQNDWAISAMACISLIALSVICGIIIWVRRPLAGRLLTE